eukprot:TRINITY_DN76087_c0_g1_i1.p1 TRINITY_DN76087_c0_g1~~TRINITY_DN76087_c0_g1_i1.p1  ORF type:complete len:277 (-),score=63.72 TRINITY_DN76087_c0_g1_i1:148-978(-)
MSSLSRGGLSRSSPTLSAAYSLRDFSLTRKRIAMEKVESAPDFSHLDRIDLIGGNGRWRQRRAEDEFARRAVVEEQRRREQEEYEEKKRQRKLALQAKKRRQQEEEERRRQEERERQLQEQRRIEEERRQAEERERLRKEQEEREWLARQPKMCETCQGSGKCHTCGGLGFAMAVYLSSHTDAHSTKGVYGRRQQGCDSCYGFKQNMMAELKKGTGKCASCDGYGLIAAIVDHHLSPAGRTRKSSGSNPTNLGFFPGAGETPKHTLKAGDGSPKAG